MYRWGYGKFRGQRAEQLELHYRRLSNKLQKEVQLQTGVQEVPSGDPNTQSPALELGIAGIPAHTVLKQFPNTFQVPLLQAADSFPENPTLQSGVQTVPLGTPLTQSPANMRL